MSRDDLQGKFLHKGGIRLSQRKAYSQVGNLFHFNSCPVRPHRALYAGVLKSPHRKDDVICSEWLSVVPEHAFFQLYFNDLSRFEHLVVLGKVGNEVSS